jgi:hypothetical protein
MTHKEKDILIGKMVDKNVSLKKRVDYLEGQKYDDTIQDLQAINENQFNDILELEGFLLDSENTKFVYLSEIRELYKRIDSKNEDIEILNALIKR